MLELSRCSWGHGAIMQHKWPIFSITPLGARTIITVVIKKEGGNKGRENKRLLAEVGTALPMDAGTWARSSDECMDHCCTDKGAMDGDGSNKGVESPTCKAPSDTFCIQRGVSTHLGGFFFCFCFPKIERKQSLEMV